LNPGVLFLEADAMSAAPRCKAQNLFSLEKLDGLYFLFKSFLNSGISFSFSRIILHWNFVDMPFPRNGIDIRQKKVFLTWRKLSPNLFPRENEKKFEIKKK
jgi:hypothetical protein